MGQTPLGIPTPEDSDPLQQGAGAMRTGFGKVDSLITSPYASVSRGSVSIPQGAAVTIISFTDGSGTVPGMWDPSKPDRINIPADAKGRYLITGHVTWANQPSSGLNFQTHYVLRFTDAGTSYNVLLEANNHVHDGGGSPKRPFATFYDVAAPMGIGIGVNHNHGTSSWGVAQVEMRIVRVAHT